MIVRFVGASKSLHFRVLLQSRYIRAVNPSICEIDPDDNKFTLLIYHILYYAVIIGNAQISSFTSRNVS